MPKALVDCPTCDGTLEVSSWTENHKVHNGIGMQTVARDHYVEIDSNDCTCEHTEEQEDRIVEKAAKQVSQRRRPRDGKF